MAAPASALAAQPTLDDLLLQTDLSALNPLATHIAALTDDPHVNASEMLQSPLFLRIKSGMMTYSGLAWCMLHQPNAILDFLKLAVVMQRLPSLRTVLLSYFRQVVNTHFVDANITFLPCENDVLTSLGERVILLDHAVSVPMTDESSVASVVVASSVDHDAAAVVAAAATAAVPTQVEVVESVIDASSMYVSPSRIWISAPDFDVALEPFVSPTRILLRNFDETHTTLVPKRPTCVRMDQTSFCMWDATVRMMDPLTVVQLHLNPTLLCPPLPMRDIGCHIRMFDKANNYKRTHFSFGCFRPVEICHIRPTIADVYQWEENGIAPKSRDMFAFIVNHLVPSHRDDYEVFGRYFHFLMAAKYPYIYMFTSWLYHQRYVMSAEAPLLYEHLVGVQQK